MTPPPLPTVVKLGGSLAQTSALAHWLAALATCNRPLVIVPGGGVFADAVRSLQSQLSFDDVTAHHMALIAMQQYGLALLSMSDRLVFAETREAIFAALRAGKVACWNPLPMSLADEIPKTWEMTSDSLAAWLAGKLEADNLLIVKSRDLPDDAITAAHLAKAGVVDPLFPEYAAASRTTVHIAGPHALAGAAKDLAEGRLPGRAIHVG
jgi:5-(aminomethyl)-3-furanmethanol phosphate kinase